MGDGSSLAAALRAERVTLDSLRRHLVDDAMSALNGSVGNESPPFFYAIRCRTLVWRG